MGPMKYFTVALFLIVIFSEYNCQLEQYESDIAGLIAPLDRVLWFGQFVKHVDDVENISNKTTLYEYLESAPIHLEAQYEQALNDLLKREGSAKVKSIDVVNKVGFKYPERLIIYCQKIKNNEDLYLEFFDDGRLEITE